MSSPDDVYHEMSLDLPAAHRGVRIARSVVQRFARMQGMPQDEADSMTLVVSEMLGNAIDHGGGGAAMTEEDLESPVRVRMTFVLTAAEWRLSVTDQGGADPEEVERLIEAANSFDLEHDRGRGLFLLKASVDELVVETNDEGTGLTIRAVKQYDRGG